MKLTIGHMYPDLLNLYGDRGNIITLKRRCEWRGIDTEIKSITIDTNTDFTDIDILFLGGGSDREQKIVSDDLTLKRAKNLKSAIEDGLTLLSICGGYQLLGKYYLSSDGNKLPGIGALDIYTIAGNKRMIDNIIIDASIDGKTFKMVGFENHSGKTFLQNVKPLGRVIYGNGNNGEDGMEGTVYKNTFGTYLHGPVLPKNPEFTDMLIKKALDRKYGKNQLEPLDDSFEHLTQNAIIKRFSKK
ncbi:glutamine amidotransferase [Thermoanaerobacterium thermosaccharolyticum]|uniref:Lipid II isoglutaminyl synthase (glutamine-hydrolyzing) subunit GatD n=1 Tax=Thermoanaerobacterium thermosaccharolyticum TaxID=1517 RepID=A0A231VEN4_THETR|nr:glutamine amidotransferase [Thermoanaerobacterium thermosaccharolyticum]OXT06643.1 glutamine amidotransferase [Thermoanaerobacterium thermosaccharolyticum]